MGHVSIYDMEIKRVNYKTALLIAVICNLMLTGTSVVYAAIDVPENGVLIGSGNRWDCNKGYWKNIRNKSCDKVNVPKNGYLAYDGHSWVCNKGYLRNSHKEICDKIIVPENGSLSSDGHSWFCNVGYKESPENNSCEQITQE